MQDNKGRSRKAQSIFIAILPSKPNYTYEVKHLRSVIMVMEQNFLMRIELMGNFQPVMKAARSKTFSMA